MFLITEFSCSETTLITVRFRVVLYAYPETILQLVSCPHSSVCSLVRSESRTVRSAVHSVWTFVWQHIVQLVSRCIFPGKGSMCLRIDRWFYNRRSVLLILYENAMPVS